MIKLKLLVLSFSSSNKTSSILLGVALGTLFSHGIAILFGSTLGLLGNDRIHYFLEISTYITFIIIGSILGMLCSNLIAIILGKFVSKKISEKTISKISGIIFLIFGILGFIS